MACTSLAVSSATKSEADSSLRKKGLYSYFQCNSSRFRIHFRRFKFATAILRHFKFSTASFLSALKNLEEVMANIKRNSFFNTQCFPADCENQRASYFSVRADNKWHCDTTFLRTESDFPMLADHLSAAWIKLSGVFSGAPRQVQEHERLFLEMFTYRCKSLVWASLE